MAESGAIRAGRAFVELFLEDSQVQRDWKRVEARLKSTGAAVAEIGRKGLALGAAIAGPIVPASRAYAVAGDTIAKTSDRTGIAVENLSALGYAASQSDVEMSLLESSIVKMQRTLVEAGQGSKQATDALSRLNLSASQLQGLSPDEQFKVVADALANIQDPAQQAAAAIEIFGRAGAELKPLITSGRQGIEELESRARSLGLTLSDASARGAVEFGDRMADVAAIVKRLAYEVGTQAAPTILRYAEQFAANVRGLTAWVSQHQGAVTAALKLGAAIAGLGGILLGAGTLIKATASALGAIRMAALASAGGVNTLKAAMIALAANPIVATLTLAVAALVGVAYWTQRAAMHTSQLAAAMEGIRTAGDKQRAADLARMNRLEQLANKEERTAADMAEAQKIIEELGGRYDGLGLSVDGATGQINGMAAAQERLNDAMRESAIHQLNMQILETTGNISQIVADMEALKESLENEGIASRASRVVTGYGKENEWIEERSKMMDAEIEKLEVLRERMKALQEAGPGSRPTALTGDIPGVTGSPSDLEDANAKAAAERSAANATERERERLADLEERHLARHRDRVRQEILLVQREAEERRQALRKLIEMEKDKGKAGSQGHIDMYKGQLAQVDRDLKRDQDAIYARQEDEAARTRQEFQDRLQDEIARLRIEAGTKPGKDRDLEMLKLDLERELDEAQRVGASADAVRAKYELRRKLIEQTDEANAPDVSVNRTAVAVQNPIALAQMAARGTNSLLSKIADSSSETAKRLRELLSKNLQPTWA